MTTGIDLPAIREEATRLLADANSVADIEISKSKILGKSSQLTLAKSRVGSLDPADRKPTGQALNELRAVLENEINEQLEQFKLQERTERYRREAMDLTEIVADESIGSAHLITQTTQRLEDVMVGMGFFVAEGPLVETEWHNFDALNIPKSHPARDGFDTLYVDYGKRNSTLLRTHTSPVQIRTMLTHEPPIYCVAPGRVFRRDTQDATHMPMFHQLEGLVVDKGISMADLAGTIEAFTTSYFGEGFTSRLRPNYFPFTEPSAEFDVRRPDGSWLELGGCGMVHPNVLRAGGIDPEAYSGFAFGFGIDRLAIIKHDITFRDLFGPDIRVLNQF